MINLIKPTIIAAGFAIGDYFSFSNFISTGGFVSNFVPAAMVIAGLIVLFYFLYAGFKYLTSGGNKEALAQAREMMIHSIIGIILFFAIFVLISFILYAFGLPDIFG